MMIIMRGEPSLMHDMYDLILMIKISNTLKALQSQTVHDSI